MRPGIDCPGAWWVEIVSTLGKSQSNLTDGDGGA